MPFCFGWRSSPFWCCFVSGICISLLLPCPVRPAGGCDRACLPLDVVVVARPHMVPGFEFWRPLLVPCSLCSPASKILLFFLGIFRGGSSGISSSHCWSLLNWRHLSVFRPLLWVAALLSGLRAGVYGLPLLRIGHARVWVVGCPPLLRERRAAAALVPLMPCASAGISFRSIMASSRLSSVWWIRRACAVLLLPRLFHRPISPRYGCV